MNRSGDKHASERAVDDTVSVPGLKSATNLERELKWSLWIPGHRPSTQLICNSITFTQVPQSAVIQYVLGQCVLGV